VRLVKSSKDSFEFHLGRREKTLLLNLLKLYPAMPPAHHRLSKSTVDEGSQALLDEALAEQRAANQAQIGKMIDEPVRWTQVEKGWRLTLSAAELEALLQVLNDIRVGHWVLLGSPEDKWGELTEATTPHLWAMEMAGAFEVALLGALEREP
jgi:hypothetical protein